MEDNAPSKLYLIALLSVNKNELIAESNKEKFDLAQSTYNEADAELNALWESLPESVRTSMKSSQLTWVKGKTVKCGKLSDVSNNTLDITTKVNIFSCQTRMTNERITLLGGDK